MATSGLLTSLVRPARAVYRRLPFRWLRYSIYRAFAWLVRHRRVVRRIDGMDYELDLGETIDLNLFLGEFERDIHVLSAEFCRPGMVVADIGANIGAHTLLFAGAVAPSGRVLAFEPTDYAFGKLERNASLNRGVVPIETVHVALSDTTGPEREVDFRSSWPTFGKRRDGISHVGFDTFDAWCARNGVESVDVIKLDVDGHEYPIVRGAEGMIRRSWPVIFIECGKWHFDGSGNPLARLQELGYTLEHAKTRKRYVHVDEVLQDLEGVESFNIVAVHGDRRG
jgi:FkbM family methyltransferase